MINALNQLVRPALLAAVVALVCCLATPASAQLKPCVCDVVTASVDPDVPCSVTFYAQAPLCRFAPVTVAPGTSGTIACCEDLKISLTDCQGNSYTFEPGGPACFFGIPLAIGCCVDACITQDANGCPEIRVRRHIGKCLGC